MENMSLQDTENSKLCLPAWLCKAAFCGGLCYCSSQERGSSAHQGGKASQMHLLPVEGTAGVTLYGYHKISVLWISCSQKQEFQAVRVAFWPCSPMFQLNFTWKKKRYYAKIPIGCRCTDKAALLQHTEMLMWALRPQEQVLSFCKERELKLQSSNHWLFWRTVNAFDWQKHTEALQRSVSPTEIPGVTAQQASKGL